MTIAGTIPVLLCFTKEFYNRHSQDFGDNRHSTVPNLGDNKHCPNFGNNKHIQLFYSKGITQTQEAE